MPVNANAHAMAMARDRRAAARHERLIRQQEHHWRTSWDDGRCLLGTRSWSGQGAGAQKPWDSLSARSRTDSTIVGLPQLAH